MTRGLAATTSAFALALALAAGLGAALSLPAGAQAAADAGDGSGAEKTRIILVAGKRSHGYGSHEHRAGCILLAHRLNVALNGVEATVHSGPWPEDPAEAFAGAAAVVLYMDGGGGHPVLEHLGAVGQLMEAGTGLVCIHYAVEVPVGDAGERFKEWIGGYYETQWSINPHWTARAQLNRGHPIARGVEPFAVKDEWYFNMRFRDGMKGVVPVLQAVPDDEARSGKSSWPRGPKRHIVEASGRSEILCWAVEREGGGRGVGFTGGHFHHNWADDGYRKLVLNAITWAAQVEVPQGGVASSTPDTEELEANQDFKKPRGS